MIGRRSCRRKYRSRFGSDNTHWRTGSRGKLVEIQYRASACLSARNLLRKCVTSAARCRTPTANTWQAKDGSRNKQAPSPQRQSREALCLPRSIRKDGLWRSRQSSSWSVNFILSGSFSSANALRP